MSITEPETPAPGRLHGLPGEPVQYVVFDRRELHLILTLYSRQVSAGAWRDYTLTFGRDMAVFSIHRRTSESPLFRIEKRPKLRHRQGVYAVVAAGGRILKRGHDLDRVLAVLDRRQLSVIK